MRALGEAPSLVSSQYAHAQLHQIAEQYMHVRRPYRLPIRRIRESCDIPRYDMVHLQGDYEEANGWWRWSDGESGWMFMGYVNADYEHWCGTFIAVHPRHGWVCLRQDADAYRRFGVLGVPEVDGSRSVSNKWTRDVPNNILLARDLRAFLHFWAHHGDAFKRRERKD